MAPLRFGSVWSPGLSRAGGQPSGDTCPALGAHPPARGKEALGPGPSERVPPAFFARAALPPSRRLPGEGSGEGSGEGRPARVPGSDRPEQVRGKAAAAPPGPAMVQAWYMDKSADDPRRPHRGEPALPVGLEQLRGLGVLYWKVRGTGGAVGVSRGGGSGAGARAGGRGLRSYPRVPARPAPRGTGAAARMGLPP